jgi:signal transduction histidine kinase
VLDEFLRSHREAIIAKARARVGARTNPTPTHTELTSGIPRFLDQLGDALRRAAARSAVDHADLSETAREHGGALLQRGLTIGQVVYDYGDICQSVTELAVELGAPISGDEFRVLNLCVDEAIAGAVTEYASQREHAIVTEGSERMGVLAHELRGVLSTVTLAYGSLLSGKVAIGGSTGQLLGRGLIRLAGLIDGPLAGMRLDAGVANRERFSVMAFLEELAITGSMHAQARGVHFTIGSVAEAVAIEGDRTILIAAVSNVLRNAFRFTPERGRVTLETRVTRERVLFDVSDECGGLPAGKLDELLARSATGGADRAGMGLGLSICAKAVAANGGTITARDVSGAGCVFTLDLPLSSGSRSLP